MHYRRLARLDSVPKVKVLLRSFASQLGGVVILFYRDDSSREGIVLRLGVRRSLVRLSNRFFLTKALSNCGPQSEGPRGGQEVVQPGIKSTLSNCKPKIRRPAVLNRPVVGDQMLQILDSELDLGGWVGRGSRLATKCSVEA